MLEVHILRALKDNFVYVLHDSPSGKTAVVDPSEFSVVEGFLQEKQWSLTQILCTHHHWDHVGGAVELQKKYSAPIYSSAYDFQRIEGATVAVNEGDHLRLGESHATALFIPGHTLGHWAPYFTDADCIFVGDTLFSAGCGRLFEGTYSQMFHSLAKIKSQVKSDTKIYFGHEYTLKNLEFVETHCPDIDTTAYRAQVAQEISAGGDSTPSTLETEMKVNPFMRAETIEEFKRLRELRNEF
jgi:hydroxyacylglutathione hydrolase